MPRLAVSANEERNKVLVSTIKYNQSLYDVSDEALAKLLNISRSTLMKRFDDPSLFSFGDLWQMNRVLYFTQRQFLGIAQGKNLF